MLKEVMLILTEGCNLSCSYCFEHYKSDKRMKFETAKKIIDAEMSMEDGADECRFTLFGGEPFLEKQIIKEIYGYIESNMPKWRKKAVIFVNTNGTLLDAEMKQWLRERKEHIYCGISLDGTREMHNQNRSDSFDRIDLDFFRECWPGQNVKMTVSKETLPSLAEGVIFIHEKGFPCGCTFAYGMEWSDDLIHGLKGQLDKLVAYYTENPNLPLCQILNIDLTGILKKPDAGFKRCGAGELMKAYDTEGKLYPCHSFSPVGLGEEAGKFVDYKLPAADIHEEKRCVECKYHFVCPTCYGVNYIYTGSVSNRSKWLCEFFKLCVQASAVIQLRRLETKGAERLDQHDYGTLLAIQSCIQGESIS